MTTRTVPRGLTYRPDGEHSFFKDLLALQAPDGFLPPSVLDETRGAWERLDRHRRETEVIHDRGEEDREFNRFLREAGLEARVNPNTTLGTGGEFAPPGWLIDQYTTAARASRPLGDLVPNVFLPANVSSIHVPRIIAGFSDAVQTVQGGDDPEADATTGDASSNVVTVSGDGIVSQQLLDLTPIGFDIVMYKDLSEDYARSLETQLINGTGTAAGQLLGLLNVTGIVTVTFTTGSPTYTLLGPIAGQCFAQLADARGLPPEVWLMRGARWAWIATSLDNQNRPIVTPGNNRPAFSDNPVAGRVEPYGPWVSCPVYVDGAIPATLGAGLNQDLIVATRASDHLLFESAFRFLVAPDVMSGTLQVRIRLHRYAAFLGNRIPTSTAVITGTGLVVQSGF